MKVRTQKEWDSPWCAPLRCWTMFRIYFRSELRGTGANGCRVAPSPILPSLCRAIKYTYRGL